ncbi:hypothetical protein QYE76_070575 [Lolium multiflorum]|uniref:Retrotransposon Copia-like N-terminal domain-containing protein n=1 Tax=Lolium multiflorum TaxID=4521 RepID=A0AAD8SKU9_LOLMU|nr:hypothetical protein QYE76_070575 [Lolium multiflorum]
MTTGAAASSASGALPATDLASTAPAIPPSLARLLATSATSQMASLSTSRPLYLEAGSFSGLAGTFPPPPPTFATTPSTVGVASPFTANNLSGPPIPSQLAPAASPAIVDAQASADAAAPTPYQLTNLITVRLKPDNYLYWRAQILPLVRRRCLDGFVDGSFACPSRTVAALTADDTRVEAENPLYAAWVAQDQAIVSALQSSLTEGVAGHVLFAATSHDIWRTFEQSYAQQSVARGNDLRRQLGDCKKLNSSAHDYFNKIKTISNTVTSIGQPLRDTEFVEHVLHGLDKEYDNLVEHVEDRPTPILPHELYTRLLATERHVEARRQEASVVHDLAAHAAYRGAPSGGRAPAPSPRPLPLARPLEAARGRLARLLEAVSGNLAHRLRHPRVGTLAPHANCVASWATLHPGATVASSATSSASTMMVAYFDTGATDHMTSEMGKLNSNEPYRGQDKVCTADGSDLGAAEWERSKITNQDLNLLKKLGISKKPKRFASPTQPLQWGIGTRVQPLQARKNPLRNYAGDEDTDRLSTNLEVKDLDRLIRKISSLKKKDSIPSTYRVTPYSAANALPKDHPNLVSLPPLPEGGEVEERAVISDDNQDAPSFANEPAESRKSAGSEKEEASEATASA